MKRALLALAVVRTAVAEPIKTVGTHMVPVQLHDEVSAELTVEVVASA